MRSQNNNASISNTAVEAHHKEICVDPSKTKLVQSTWKKTRKSQKIILDDPSKIVWTKVMTTTLIELLKASPPLWDVSCPDYRNRLKRDKCWDNISDTMKVHPTEIKSKVLKLRTQYSNERNKMRKLKSGGGSKEQYITKWEFFFSLNFLFQKEGAQYRNVDSMMWSFIDPATSEDELEVNQKFYNFKDLEKKVQQYAKKHGVHKFKIKSSHNIPMNMIKDTENVSEELANNIRALRYREILFCCHTFDLNLSKKKLLLDNTSIKQCPAEVKAAWIKLGEADDDYVEGSIERALLVTRIVNHHDHEFYENTLRDLAKHTKEKRKNVTANSGMGREEKNTSPELIFDSNKKESPEPINYYRLITKGVNTEEEERDIKVTALFDKFKNIMVHKSTSREFNEQLHTLQQILDCFQSNVNILLPTDIPMRNVSTQNASTIRDNSNTSVETNHNVSKENVSQNVSLENRKNVELTDRTKNMVSDYPDESLSVSKDPDFPIFSQSTIATNLDSTNLTNINTSIFRYLQSDATILRRQESRVACNAENENGVDKEENAVEIGMDENNLEVNIEENQNGVVTKNNETEVDTEKKENEVNNEENKNEVDDSVLGIQSIQETAKTSPAKEVTTINAISEGKEPNPDHPPSSKVESGPPSKDRIQPSKKARYVEKSSEELQELAVLNRCMTEISNATPIDEFSVFGDFVASELRNLKFAPDLQSKLKRAIQRIALDVADEYAHRVYDSRQSTSDSEMKISPGNTLTENTDISSDNEIISPENT